MDVFIPTAYSYPRFPADQWSWNANMPCQHRDKTGHTPVLSEQWLWLRCLGIRISGWLFWRRQGVSWSFLWRTGAQIGYLWKRRISIRNRKKTVVQRYLSHKAMYTILGALNKVNFLHVSNTFSSWFVMTILFRIFSLIIFRPHNGDMLGCRIRPSLQWRRNEPGGVSNHGRPDCLLNRLFPTDT